MRYADIKPFDINNGFGIRVSFWVTGCPIKCKGCHNKEIWNKDSGYEYNENTEQYILELLGEDNKDLSILGGEPLAYWNYEGVLGLVKKVKEVYPNNKIWIWTGYDYEQVKDYEIMQYIDVLIDGMYIEGLKDEETWWRGSSNQRMIKLNN